MATFEEVLARDGRLVYKTKGTSMEPMLRQNRDLVIIRVPEGRLSRYDVALYRRGRSYVLHRVMDVRDGYYLIRGDNTFFMEQVPDSDVIGVLEAFVRKGKQHGVDEPGYRTYVSAWHAIYPVRAALFRVKRLAGKLAKKLGFRRRGGKIVWKPLIRGQGKL